MSTRSADAKQIFLDALDLPATQRRSFIDSACGADDELCERVLALLNSNDTANGILDRSLPVNLSALERIGRDQSPGRVGDYQLLSVLGRGGFGVVWLAAQHEPIQRRVALKLLHPSLVGFGAHPAAAIEVITRFEAERQALASMDHPNVARVIDAGTVDEGPHANQPYFAMEYVDGSSITEYCDQQCLDIDARLRLFVDVCAGVQHAHQRGLIHRDLKPSNVLVATVDSQPVPKVIDFGVSKAIGEMSAPTAITQVSSVIGTPQYMSPEQAEQNGAHIDTRSDVYSLGAMLYELLSGSPPIAADTIRGLPLGEICRLVREAVPAPLSSGTHDEKRTQQVAMHRATDPARLAARLRGELDWILLRSLAKEPDRRYPTVADFAADIVRHLSHQPVTAGPPSMIYRARKFVRRHRATVSMVALALALLVTATIVSLTMATKARRAEGEAVRQTELTRKELAKFTAMATFSQGILRGIDPAIARGRDVELMREVLERTSRRAKNTASLDPEVSASIHSMLGYAYGAIGDTGMAVQHYSIAMQMTRKAFGDDHPNTLKETGNYFTSLMASKRYDDAEKLIEPLAQAYDRTGTGSGDDAIAFYSNFGAFYINTGRPQLAIKWLERAAEAMRSREVPAQERLALQNNLAAVYFELGDLERARQVWDRLFNEQLTILGDDHPAALITMHNLGQLAAVMGEFERAEQLMKRAVAGKQRVLPAGHPSRTMSETDLANYYFDQGRFDLAAKVLQTAYADLAAVLPPHDSRRISAAVMLADALRRGGLHTDAVEILDTYAEAFATDRGGTIGRSELAVRLAVAADQRDRTACDSVLATFRASPSTQPATVVEAALNLHAARCLAVLGRNDEAKQQLNLARAAAARLGKSEIVKRDVESFKLD